MLFFVPPQRRQALRMRLKNLLCIPLSFSTRGSHVVLYEPEELYDQALAKERNVIYGQTDENKAVKEITV
jgi:hypothetical protein